MRELNILVVGVGGQGILTLSRVLGEASVLEGLNVLVAETHGLSQRGGSVIVHVRIGDDIESPLVPLGEANLLLGLELLETLRASSHMREDGVIVADNIIIPVSIPGARTPDMSGVLKAIKSLNVKAHIVEASVIAEKLGDIRVANMYLLGHAYARTGLREILSVDSLSKAIRQLPSPDLNLKAFMLGHGSEGV